MKSKISVALCTYNGEKFIQKQLDSIVNQTITVDEIILCDDCSKDNTVNIINKYIEKYPSLFKLFINKTNLKSNANFEKAIQLTTGDYIFLADQDDVWRNDKVEKTLAIFNKNNKAEGVFSNANFIDENDNRIYDKLTLWEFVSFFENENFNPTNIKKLLINKGNYLTGATLCIKKEVKAFSIPFKTGDDFIHDEWLAFQLANRETLYYSTENLISYRIHQNQQLGLGNVNKISRIRKQNLNSYNLILENKKPNSFKDYKITTRAYFFQYNKYKKLNEKYNYRIFSEIKEMLLEKYIEEDKKMKKCNPILYFFRKMKDKKKGKRIL